MLARWLGLTQFQHSNVIQQSFFFARGERLDSTADADHHQPITITKSTSFVDDRGVDVGNYRATSNACEFRQYLFEIVARVEQMKKLNNFLISYFSCISYYNIIANYSIIATTTVDRCRGLTFKIP